MYQNFDEIIEKAKAMPQKRTIVISAAGDETMMHVAQEAIRQDLCRVIMVGDAEILEGWVSQMEEPKCLEIIDEKDKAVSCLTAASLVREGRGQVLVKGNVNNSDFLRAVLNKEKGLRGRRKLNVLSCYEVPGEKKLFFMADGGMIIAPTLEDKVDILHNCVPALHRLGIEKPKVAILAANEKVSESMPATVDARELCELYEKGGLPEAVYEGPIAFDVAVNPKAAQKKGIDSRVSGDVDLFLGPSIETGNCLGKAIGYYAKGTMAGLVLGATHPVIMSSRAASLRGKITSIAWALLTCE